MSDVLYLRIELAEVADPLPPHDNKHRCQQTKRRGQTERNRKRLHGRSVIALM